MTPTFDLVALGEAMVEFNQSAGSDARTYLQGFGGDTSNAAIAAARLGARTAYVSRVGNDAFGRLLLALWQKEGVDTQGVGEDPDAPTGVYFVTHGASGHEFSYLRAGSAASRLAPANLPQSVVTSARVLHLSGISQAISAAACDACFAAIDLAHRAGAKVSYDTNLRLKLWPLTRARAIMRETARHVDWMLPSLDDAALLFGVTDPDGIVDACHALGAPLVALKLGPQGCVVSDGQRRVRVPGMQVATVDATGAGDCFDGAFIARMAVGEDPFTAARYANAAAALATTGFGAVAPLPDGVAVARFMSERAAAALAP